MPSLLKYLHITHTQTWQIIKTTLLRSNLALSIMRPSLQFKIRHDLKIVKHFHAMQTLTSIFFMHIRIKTNYSLNMAIFVLQTIFPVPGMFAPKYQTSSLYRGHSHLTPIMHIKLPCCPGEVHTTSNNNYVINNIVPLFNTKHQIVNNSILFHITSEILLQISKQVISHFHFPSKSPSLCCTFAPDFTPGDVRILFRLNHLIA